ncbi:hypothetical protein HY380_01620 [Candidatus Saccharibacteria bacterium]|nr:hypothetical protein [Candidatus Saccharibacteria bacterium]
MFERSAREKIITKTITWSFLLAVIIFCALLVIGAGNLANNLDRSLIYEGHLGSLALFKLEKMPMSDGGFSASISLTSGTAVYFGLWLLVALVVTGWRIRGQKSPADR